MKKQGAILRIPCSTEDYVMALTDITRSWFLRRLCTGLPFLLCLLVLSAAISEAAPPQRIVSLAPSITELLFAMGLEAKIAGVTNFCDFPAEAALKPKVGGMSNPSLEAVMALRPDLVILTTNGNPKDFEERLRSLGLRTYVFRARKISDFPAEVRRLGAVLEAREKAETLARSTETALNRLKRDAGNVPAGAAGRKAVFIIWPEPLIVAGRGVIADEAMELLGLHNIAGRTIMEYPKYSIEEMIREAPEIIFVGKGHKDMAAVSQGLLMRLGSVPAVRNKRVFYVGDGLYRLGPRTMDGVEELAALLGGL